MCDKHTTKRVHVIQNKDDEEKNEVIVPCIKCAPRVSSLTAGRKCKEICGCLFYMLFLLVALAVACVGAVFSYADDW